MIEHKKYVKIQASKTFIVTPDLSYVDLTDAKSSNPNKLRIVPGWVKKEVMLKKGAFFYPYEVSTWKTTKVLAEKGYVTVGGESDVGDEQAEKTASVLEQAKASAPKVADIKLEDAAK